MKNTASALLLSTIGLLSACNSAPRSIPHNSRCIEVDFIHAQERLFIRDETISERRPCQHTPLRVYFPNGQHSFNYERQADELPPHTDADLASTTVRYTQKGHDASICIIGFQLHAELRLKYETPNSGTATFLWGMDEASLEITGATFRVYQTDTTGGKVELPQEK